MEISDIFNIFKRFFFQFLPSAVNMGTDTYSAATYFTGTNYTKYTATENDSRVTNCTQISYTHQANTTQYKWRCMEEDPIWGVVTLLLMFVPGFFFSAIFWRERLFHSMFSDWSKLSGRKYGLKYSGRLLLITVLTVTFPLQLIVFKLADLIIYDLEPFEFFGRMWDFEELALSVTFVEGWLESTGQLSLQLFIVLSSDRQPSIVQWVTLVTSFIMIAKVSISAFLENADDMSLITKCFLFPLFLFTTVHKVLSLVINYIFERLDLIKP